MSRSLAIRETYPKKEQDKAQGFRVELQACYTAYKEQRTDRD